MTLKQGSPVTGLLSAPSDCPAKLKGSQIIKLKKTGCVVGVLQGPFQGPPSLSAGAPPVGDGDSGFQLINLKKSVVQSTHAGNMDQ